MIQKLMGSYAESPVHLNRWSIDTRWSLIHSIREGSSDDKQAALEAFCQSYWRPVYSFVRARGHSQEDAEDLTQDYFCRIMRNGVLAKVFQKKGKLRAFLLTDIKFYLRDAWAKRTSKKRGGNVQLLSINSEEWELDFQMKLASDAPPDEVFDRSWGMVVLETAALRLEEQFAARGRLEVFNALRGFLSPEDEPSYEDVAKKLDMKINAVQSAVHRMRAQFRLLLRDCVGATMSSPGDIGEELRYLQRLFSG